MRTIQTGSHHFRACAAIALAISLFMGCSNPVTRPTSGVLVRLGEISGERTLLPTGAGLYYTLTFTKGADTVNEVLASGTTKTVVLDEGGWDLSVKGYQSQADAEADPAVTPVASGNVTNIWVNRGATKSVEVKLSASMPLGDTGTLNYTVTFPNDPAVSAATLSYVKFDTSIAPVTVDLLSDTAPNTITGTAAGSDPRTATGSIDLDAGYYRISIHLFNGSTVEEGDIAHIYDHLETPAVFTYTAGSFFGPPDTTDLLAFIDAANALKARVYPSENGGWDVPDEFYWVIPDLLDTFNEAITAAQDVADDPESQEAVHDAEEDMRLAISYFNGQLARGIFVPNDLGVYVGSSLDVVPDTETLALSLSWLQTNAADNTGYTILLGADENLPPWTLGGSSSGPTTAADGKTGVKLTLKGKDTVRTVQLSANGALFTVGAGLTLVLGENITLQGRSSNTASLVSVAGALEMKAGAKISGNSGSFLNGGGVYVSAGGAFTMGGGEISGNSVSGNDSHSPTIGSGGGGVYVDGGTFTMSGGEISGNSASGNGNDTTYGGGGVYVNTNGTFTMSGGVISDNTVTSGKHGGGVCVFLDGTFTMSGGEISGNSDALNGGGVYVSGGTFTMSDGKVSDNTISSGEGGGVYVANGYGGISGTFTMGGGEISDNSARYGGGVSAHGTFTMSGGKVSGNTASSGNGGGVYVDTDGTFAMNGGEISDNSTGGDGGGVYVGAGIFAMTGGEISDNSAGGDGGGVYVVVYLGSGGSSARGTFTKIGGSVISGNTATSTKGHALNVNEDEAMRNANIGSGQNIYIAPSGAIVWVYSPALTDPFWDN
jgi:hypothetical protein